MISIRKLKKLLDAADPEAYVAIPLGDPDDPVQVVPRYVYTLYGPVEPKPWRDAAGVVWDRREVCLGQVGPVVGEEVFVRDLAAAMTLGRKSLQ